MSITGTLFALLAIPAAKPVIDRNVAELTALRARCDELTLRCKEQAATIDRMQIDNVRLFEQVLAAREQRDSILRRLASMDHLTPMRPQSPQALGLLAPNAAPQPRDLFAESRAAQQLQAQHLQSPNWVDPAAGQRLGQAFHNALEWCNCVPARHDMLRPGR